MGPICPMTGAAAPRSPILDWRKKPQVTVDGGKIAAQFEVLLLFHPFF